MITNEERREVAAKLREIDFEWVSESSARLLFKIEHVLGLYKEGSTNYEGVANRLADLIEPEERTCQMEPTFITPTTLCNIQEYTCSKCGKFTFSQIFGDDEDVPRYCSYCGAKVANNMHTETKKVDCYNGHVVEVDGQRYVPERFCKIIFKEERFALCSCGHGIFSDMIYCPRCGAKVPENLWE